MFFWTFLGKNGKTAKQRSKHIVVIVFFVVGRDFSLKSVG